MSMLDCQPDSNPPFDVVIVDRLVIKCSLLFVGQISITKPNHMIGVQLDLITKRLIRYAGIIFPVTFFTW